jgi:hypothetical protein
MMYRLLPFVLILAALGILFGYVNPKYTGDITSNNQTLAASNAALAASQDFMSKENQLIAQRNSIDPANLARLQTFMPNSIDNIQLITDVSALIARSGLSLTSISVSANAVAAPSAGGTSGTAAAVGSGGTNGVAGNYPLQSTSLTNSLDLVLSVTGSYAAFQTFLLATEQSLRPMNVVHLDLKDSTTGVYSYDVTFRLYWLR